MRSSRKLKRKKGKMPLLEETVKGYEAFKEKIAILEKSHNKIYIVFTGGEEKTSRLSWCPDCNDFYTTFAAFKMKHQLEGFLLYVDVGQRGEWKDKASPFRTDPLLKLTSIPTLMMWGTPKKLSNDLILQEDALEMLFEDDD